MGRLRTLRIHFIKYKVVFFRSILTTMKHFIYSVFYFSLFLVCIGFGTISEGTLTENQTVLAASGIAIPTQLSIAHLGITSSIEPVGQSLTGAMAVPSSPDIAGWYNLGVRPGEVGSAVIAGHVNWTNHQDAIFTNLHRITTGDEVTVTNSQGITNTFIVYNIKQYPEDGDTETVFLQRDGSYLNLITCAGPWNNTKKTHDLRLVVFAIKK